MNTKTTTLLINSVSILAIVAGGLGMLFCFPFLWSARIEDLVGAGLPFVGGSILFGAGLVTLGIMNSNKKI